jgi:multiple sugar transport system substrate-binding protein
MRQSHSRVRGIRQGWTRWLLAAAMLLVVISGALSQMAAAQEPASIRFAFWGDPAEQEAYQRVIDGFSAANPAIEVTADYTPGQGDYYQKIATDYAGGDPPDVFLINYRNFGQYAATGGLEPIEPYMNESDEFEPEDFYDVPMDAFRYRGGEVVCMPQNISNLVVYYNTDMFEANDVPLPADGWSWDEFIAAATALTRDTDGDGTTDQFGVVVEPSMYRMVSFIWSAGGEIVDDVDNPTTLTLDTPEAREGIEKFVSLGVSGHNVVPPEAEVAAEDDTSRFMRGGAAMFMQSRRPVPTLREIEGFTWDVTTLPVIDQPATVLHSDAFCMASAAENKEAVWTFIEYAASAEGQSILAETGRTVPSMMSVAESDVFIKGLPIPAGQPGSNAEADEMFEAQPPANSQVYLDNIASLYRLPSISTWPEIEDAVTAEFDRAFYEEIDIDAAITAATENSAAAFERAAEEDGV